LCDILALRSKKQNNLFIKTPEDIVDITCLSGNFNDTGDKLVTAMVDTGYNMSAEYRLILATYWPLL
jgi:hypothetical protein